MSKIRFEHINGTLCRMVEPEPLTPDSQFPCVVRLIQDDSPMGRYNKYVWGPDTLSKCFPVLMYEKNITLPGQNSWAPHCSKFEIIGHPVEDGSHYWALYQMMQGHEIINSNGTIPFCHHEDRILRCGDDISWDIGHWLRIYDDTRGWQLYEPKPLLADAKAGDLVKRRDGKWAQIVKVDDYQPSGWKHNHPIHGSDYGFVRQLNGKLDAREINSDGHLDIIHTEPLAPEGADKWAWQMMLLGKKVCQKHNSYFPNKRYYTIKDGNDYCAFYENNGNEVNITNTRRTYDEFIEYCKFTPQYNWQLYTEPQTEPCEICGGIGMISCEACNATGRVPISQPTYAVGDWVEFNPGNNPIQVKIVKVDREKLHYVDKKGYQTHIYASAITRKLQPSEVIVRIGCLSGTVMANGSPFMETDTGFWLVSLDSEEHENCYIPFTMCDLATRSLVEDLLKAQEEK